jgi:hypothetical protein
MELRTSWEDCFTLRVVDSRNVPAANLTILLRFPISGSETDPTLVKLQDQTDAEGRIRLPLTQILRIPATGGSIPFLALASNKAAGHGLIEAEKPEFGFEPNSTRISKAGILKVLCNGKPIASASLKLGCPGRTYAVCQTGTEHVGPVKYGEFFEKKPVFFSSHFDLQVTATVDSSNVRNNTFGVEIPPKCGKACKFLLFVAPPVVAVLVARHITRTPPSPVITFDPPRVTPPPGVVSP